MGFFYQKKSVFKDKTLKSWVFSLAKQRSGAMCLKQEQEGGELPAVVFIFPSNLGPQSLCGYPDLQGISQHSPGIPKYAWLPGHISVGLSQAGHGGYWRASRLGGAGWLWGWSQVGCGVRCRTQLRGLRASRKSSRVQRVLFVSGLKWPVGYVMGGQGWRSLSVHTRGMGCSHLRPISQ